MRTTTNHYTGKPLDEVLERLMLEFHHPYRVIKRDGVAQVATRDYNPERLNFEVEDGIVVGTTYG